MRQLLLLGSMMTLLVALWGLWNFRFERSSGFPVWQLAEIRQSAPQVPGVEWIGPSDAPVMRIMVDASHPQIAARFAIPGMTAVKMLHLQYRLTAKDLIQGKERWQDGRMMVEWCCPESGGRLSADPVGSIRDDEQGELQNLVIETGTEAAVPVLRMENLGISGAFELSDLIITVVQERAVWKIGKWFLAAAWMIWAFFVIRSWPAIPSWRAVAASAIWLVMGLQFVVPGPWKVQKPLITAFQLGAQKTAITVGTVAASTPAVTIGVVPSLGEMPVQGSLVLKIKILAAKARPFLHALLLFGPTLAMMCLIGRNPSLWLAVILSLAIESAQTAFSYGFDWIDVMDLICDAVGILLAAWLHAKLAKRWRVVFLAKSF